MSESLTRHSFKVERDSADLICSDCGNESVTLDAVPYTCHCGCHALATTSDAGVHLANTCLRCINCKNESPNHSVYVKCAKVKHTFF